MERWNEGTRERSTIVPPFRRSVVPSSFLSPGRYLISYQAFVTELVWANTLYDFWRAAR